MGAVIPISNKVITLDHYIVDDRFDVLTRIYDENVNLVVYEREVTAEIVKYSNELMNQDDLFSFTQIVKLDEVEQRLETSLPDYEFKSSFISDIYNACEIFSVLFDQKNIGLRMAVLDRAMCPRFHVDNIPCRLLITYADTGTEWLCEDNLNRKKLGRGNNGLPDNESGVYGDAARINQVNSYDIVLLKGETWPKNAGNGIVHRSPEVNVKKPRLLLSLDFV